MPTPNLDKIANEGIRFTDAHSSSGICTPSRYSLLTGRHHWRKFHGIVNSFDEPVIDNARLTLPEMLKSRGYATACIGKWHLGWNWPIVNPPSLKKEMWGREVLYYATEDIDWSKPVSGGPLDHGFDYYFGDDVPNFPPYAWIENDKVVTIPTLPLTENPPTAEGSWEARPGPMVDGWQMDAVMPELTKKAVKWINEQKRSEKPFFLYFPFTSPHAPIVPAKEFIGKSQAGGYGDFMFQTDWTVGEVLKALEKNGFRNNTLVIFTSDNGPEHYAYDRIRNFDHRSMGPLRGLKRDIWEGGHRVPFIARWPEMIKSNLVKTALICQTDIMATIASIIDYDLPDDSAEDSYDQSINLFGTSEVDIRSVQIHNTFADHYAIRKDDWLLINAKSGEVTKEPEWYLEDNGYVENEHDQALFNLSDDVSQHINLISDNPGKAQELDSILQKIREQGYSSPRLEDSN
ncbi:arylsulfatase [Bacteroidota bacterium]